MPTALIRLAILAATMLPLAGCFAYTETARPTPVYVQSPPPSGSVVVQPTSP